MKNVMVLVVFFALGAASLFAAGPVIGLAVSQGKLTVNSAAVEGNANLTSGSVVTTSADATRLQFTSGATVVLDRESTATVFADRAVLNSGTGQLGGRKAYTLEAMGFRIAADGAQARVDVKKDHVIVAALSGAVKITDAAGVPVANIAAGRALGLQPSAGAPVSTMTGRVASENGKFVLADEVSGLKVELKGQDVAKELGKRVQVTGAPKPAADKSTQIIEVARLNRVGEEPVPTPVPTPTPQAGAGMSNTAKVWIVVGVLGAVGITAGTLAATSR